jgi:hypothetical protein
MLLAKLLKLLMRWRPAFSRQRTHERMIAVLLWMICAFGRRTVTAGFGFAGRTNEDWSADYYVFSRSKWETDLLFAQVFKAGLSTREPSRFIPVAIDDTGKKKCCKSRGLTSWMRDPLSPPFHVNLQNGLRFVHAALLLQYHDKGQGCHAATVAFDLCPPVKKPGKNATEEQWAAYREQKKQHNLSLTGVKIIERLRHTADEAGYASKKLHVVVDGSYTNRTVLLSPLDRVDVTGRTGKKTALHKPATGGGRRVYGERLPTPEEIRKDTSIPYSTAACHFGGKLREVRYKEINRVLWPHGGKRRLLRLIIVAPIPYQAPGKAHRYYREPAYLLSTDLESPVADILQAYLDRWQIEPLHRDLKEGLGLGQAQVWNEQSVKRIHSAVAAIYAMLKIAALQTYGPERTGDFPPLPAWRNKNKRRRASQHDLITMLRNDMVGAEDKWFTTEEVPPEEMPPKWVLPTRETYAAA